jgi:hypothetical protein
LTVVNSALIDLYWKVGELVARKIDTDGWGKGTVAALSTYIQKRHPGLQGFSPQNVWRMQQFFDAYRDRPDLSTLLRELPWSANLHVLTKCKSPEEREFYLRTAIAQRWPVREVRIPVPLDPKKSQESPVDVPGNCTLGRTIARPRARQGASAEAAARLCDTRRSAGHARQNCSHELKIQAVMIGGEGGNRFRRVSA